MLLLSLGYSVFCRYKRVHNGPFLYLHCAVLVFIINGLVAGTCFIIYVAHPHAHVYAVRAKVLAGC